MTDKKNNFNSRVRSGKRSGEELKTSWGRWHLSTEPPTLEHRETSYEIDFSECNSSAQILDWIIQISQKSWATEDDIGSLVRALDEILDIQGHFCGGGSSREDGGEKIAEGYIKRVKNQANKR